MLMPVTTPSRKAIKPTNMTFDIDTMVTPVYPNSVVVSPTAIDPSDSSPGTKRHQASVGTNVFTGQEGGPVAGKEKS